MESTEIYLMVNGVKEVATLRYDAAHIFINFSMANGFSKDYEHDDLYLCLAKIREEFPGIKFLCKGAKTNVTPSRMCSQMSGGIVAYELAMGKSGTFDQIVNIFDYEEHDITCDPQEQVAFYKRWLESLG